MSDLDNKWQALLTAAVLAWLGWLSIMVISMNAKIETQTVVHQNVIPPVVEASLSELRAKGNSDRELLSRLMESSMANSKDISYLKEARTK